MKKDKFIWNYVIVNVSRTWERIRVTTENQEMPLDNIESVDAIIDISDTIYNGSIIQGFVNGSEKGREDYWIKNTIEGMSDWFIEAEAERIIRQDYL
jgi:phosphatidate phosphatase APP1